MSSISCPRCGSSVAGQRCLRCGAARESAAGDGAARGTTRRAGRRRRTAEDGQGTPSRPDAEHADEPRAEPSDPRLREAEERVASHEAAITSLQSRVTQLSGQLARQLGLTQSAVQASVRQTDSKLQQTLAAYESERATLVARLDREDRIRRARYANSLAQAISAAQDLTRKHEQLRPRMAAKTLTSADLCPPLHVRPYASVGDLLFPKAQSMQRQIPRLPALLPLVNQGHVVIDGPSEDPTVSALIINLVAQAFTSAPSGQMVVTVFDPRVQQTLDAFLAHGASSASKIFVQAHPSREALEKALTDHLGHFLAVGASTAKQYGSMGDLVRATGQHEHQYRVLVILDAPAFWSERAAEDLERIISQGAAAGISVIMNRKETEPIPRGVDLDKITRPAARIRRVDRGSWQLTVPSAGYETTFEPAPTPSLDEQLTLMGLVTEAAREGTLPKVPFEELVDRATSWFEPDGTPRSTADGVQITIGRMGNQTVSFTLGDTVTNLHNVLVGGRAGSGKTVLLKTMIYSMAARYSPQELRFFLLDYKDGVEFQQFASTPGGGLALPHAEVISIESDAEFGLATLEHFLLELSRRSELFRAEGNVSNLATYRERTGKVIPRWILLVDEFQGMFSGPIHRQATGALEDLVRRGRSFGLHVVLASQTISGIRFDGDKDKAIFENIPARVVLQLTPTESVKFLQSGNFGASELRYRGQAILNTQGGALGDNQQFVVAYGDKVYHDLQAKLAEQARQRGLLGRPVRVHNGADYVSSGELIRTGPRPTVEHGELPVWFGRESTVDASPAGAKLTPAAGGNLLVLGGDDLPSAIATVQTAVLTAAVAQRGLQVVVFDALHRGRVDDQVMERWLMTLTMLDADVIRLVPDEEESFLEQVKVCRDAGGPALVVLLGAENSDISGVVGLEWGDLIRELPRRGVHVIGHWSDLRDVPGDRGAVRSDYHTTLFVGSNVDTIEKVTTRGRTLLPELHRARTVVFRARSTGDALPTVASVRELSEGDHLAWERLATEVGA